MRQTVDSPVWGAFARQVHTLKSIVRLTCYYPISVLHGPDEARLSRNSALMRAIVSLAGEPASSASFRRRAAASLERHVAVVARAKPRPFEGPPALAAASETI